MKKILAVVALMALVTLIWAPTAEACEKCTFVIFVGWLCDNTVDCGYNSCTTGSGMCITSGGSCGSDPCIDATALTFDDDPSESAFSTSETLALHNSGVKVASSPDAEADAACGQLIF